MIRRICIVLVIIGAGLRFLQYDEDLPTLPFPAAGLLVRSVATLGAAGDYYVRVTMAKADASPGLNEETVPCSLVVTVTERGKPPQKKEITSLRLCSEFGFGRTQDYRGGDASQLGRGKYDIEVNSRGATAAATARGATLALEREVGNPTTYYLRNLLRSYLGTGALLVGLIGLIASELRSMLK